MTAIKVNVELMNRQYKVVFDELDGDRRMIGRILPLLKNPIKFIWNKNQNELPWLSINSQPHKEYAAKIIMAACDKYIEYNPDSDSQEYDRTDRTQSPHVRRPYWRRLHGSKQKVLQRACVVNAKKLGKQELARAQKQVDLMNAMASVVGRPVSYAEACKMEEERSYE